MNRLTITIWLLATALSACGQQEAPRLPITAKSKPEPEKVYTYVEQMPELPGGGGQQRIAMELMKRVGYPIIDLREHYTGSASIYFEVSPSGAVQHIKLLRATGSSSVDSALVTAAKKLPHFIPGYQNGKPVTVSFIIPFSCLKPQ
jgi:protein TonB